jgi:hypothetical protein
MSLGLCKLTALVLAMGSVVMGGCATVPPKNYTAFKQHMPRSILILPPLNETTEVGGDYSYYSSTFVPVAERGFYVFPAVLVDDMFKENGLPSAPDMHAVPLDKLRAIFGADAVLYITLLQYGTKFIIISSQTTVAAKARLVDTATGTLLWQGTVAVTQGSGDSGGGLIGALITAVVTQIINTKTDEGYTVSKIANAQLFIVKQGLLAGPRHPDFGKPAAR